MPRIHDRLLDGVVFLFRSAAEAHARARLGGTGFVIGRLLENSEELLGRRKYVPYLVSNRHVVFEGSACVASVNRKDGGPPDVLDIEQEAWVAHPGGDDVAVTCVNGMLDAAIHRVTHIKQGSIFGPEDIENYEVGVGDEVFMIGRFVNLQGRKANQPAARFGNISAGLSPIPVEGRLQEAFAVEMRSRTGFSGSPVLVYRTLASSLMDHAEHATDFWGLLGVNFGYVKDEEGENTWLNGVVPAWKIMEVLATPQLREIHAIHEQMLVIHAAQLRTNGG